MYSFFFELHDPGPYIICGAPHTTCTGPQPAPPEVPQQPAQTAAIPQTVLFGNSMPSAGPAAAPAPGPQPAQGETFSTSTYRRRRR